MLHDIVSHGHRIDLCIGCVEISSKNTQLFSVAGMLHPTFESVVCHTIAIGCPLIHIIRLSKRRIVGA